MPAPAVLPELDTDTDTQTRRQPPYAVILHNDDITSMDWVILVLRKVFGYTVEKCFELMIDAPRNRAEHCLDRFVGSRGTQSRSNDFLRCRSEPKSKGCPATPGDGRIDGVNHSSLAR